MRSVDERFSTFKSQERGSAKAKRNGHDGCGGALQEAINFLDWLRPHGPRALTAIIPDGMTATKSFGPKQPKSTREWLESHNGQRNVYYSLNPTPDGLSKKADKSDIVAGEFVHVDIDPREGETADECKARALADAKATDLPSPSAAIDSGNGIQFLWRLAASVAAEDVEPTNRALIEIFGAGVGTHNCDRILRLPGTINLPNKKKRREGRVECTSKLLWKKNAAYPLERFPKAETPKADRAKTRRSKGHDKPLPEVDIDELPIPEELRKQIRRPSYRLVDGKKDRSRTVVHVAGQLLRHDIDQPTIASILLNPDYGISEHILDQSDPQRAVWRAIG